MTNIESELRGIFGYNDNTRRYLHPKVSPFPLKDIWPQVIDRIRGLLTQVNENRLAESLDGLFVFDRCHCGGCSTVYTQPAPRSGQSHRGIAFCPPETVDIETNKPFSADHPEYPTTPYLTILDVVDEQIVCIEILDDLESQQQLMEGICKQCGACSRYKY